MEPVRISLEQRTTASIANVVALENGIGNIILFEQDKIHKVIDEGSLFYLKLLRGLGSSWFCPFKVLVVHT